MCRSRVHSACAEAPYTALNVFVNPVLMLQTMKTVPSQCLSTNDASHCLFCSIHGFSLHVYFPSSSYLLPGCSLFCVFCHFSWFGGLVSPPSSFLEGIVSKCLILRTVYWRYCMPSAIRSDYTSCRASCSLQSNILGQSGNGVTQGHSRLYPIRAPLQLTVSCQIHSAHLKGLLRVLQHCYLEAYCTLTRMSSFIHLQRRCTHQAAWETSSSEGRNYTWNLASDP